MNDLIKKLKEKKKKDIAHLSEKDLEKKRLKDAEATLKEIEIKEKEEKKATIHIKKELKKFDSDKKEFLKLNRAINDRFKVEKTDTAAARYKTASIYFNATEIHHLPESYFPHPREDDPDFFITPSDQHYYLWNFQMNTNDIGGGYTIPDRPGGINHFIIHAFLFPMTSTVIYLCRWDSEGNYLVRYDPNDELFGREWHSTDKEEVLDSYDKALKYFNEYIEQHLEGDEERYYDSKKQV